MSIYNTAPYNTLYPTVLMITGPAGGKNVFTLITVFTAETTTTKDLHPLVNVLIS